MTFHCYQKCFYGTNAWSIKKKDVDNTLQGTINVTVERPDTLVAEYSQYQPEDKLFYEKKNHLVLAL